MHLVDITMFYGRETGGVRTYLNAKRRWLSRRGGVRHTLVVPAQRGQRLPAGAVGLPSLPLPVANGYRLPLGPIARALCRLEPDLIEAGDPFHTAWSALAAGERLGVPVVGFYHSDLPQSFARRYGRGAQRIAAAYVRQLYGRFALVLAPSRVMAERLRALGLERVAWQPLGVDTGVFAPCRRDADLRARLGLPRETRLLVYAGRYAREKNLPALLEAMRRLGRPYHLLMVGSGEPMPPAQHVTYLPFERSPRRLARLLASCDLFVHPGDQETFGLVVLEAMACGTPVLGVGAGGVAELVDHDTGALVATAGADALADGIAYTCARDLPALGAAARRRVERHYDWDQVMRRLAARYTALALTRPIEDDACVAGAAER